MKNNISLNTLYPEWKSNKGVFHYLDAYDVPWKQAIDVQQLDWEYHGNVSGNKIVAPLLVSLISSDNGISEADKHTLAGLLYNKYKIKWDRLFQSLTLFDQVSPLDNVNEIRTETREINGSYFNKANQGAQSNNSTIGSQENTSTQGSQSNTNTQGSQSNSSTQGSQNNTEEKKLAAFNSSSYSNDGTTTTNLGNRTDSETIGQRQDSQTIGQREDSETLGQRQDSQTLGAREDTFDNTHEETETYNVNRHGNIGVTTSGQLIEDYRISVSWEFYEKVFEDIDMVLVLDMFACNPSPISNYTIKTDYKLPIASSTTLGGVKVGNNLSIDSDGTLNAQGGGSGAVSSVNGQTGDVVIDLDSLGAASQSDLMDAEDNITNLQTGKQDKLPQGQLGKFLKYGTSGEMWSDLNELPNKFAGDEGKYLKLDNDLQPIWAEGQGGGSEKIWLPENKITRWRGYIYNGNIGTASGTAEYTFAIDLTDFVDDDYYIFMEYIPFNASAHGGDSRIAFNSTYKPPQDDTTVWSTSIESNYNFSYTNWYSNRVFFVQPGKEGFYFMPRTQSYTPYAPVIGEDLILRVWKEPKRP